MTQPSDNSFVARAPRFKVADSKELSVTITRTEEGNGQALTAELLDVSQHGTKLRVPENLRFEEVLQLKIEVSGSELEYHGVASVRHIRPVDEDHWLVGCAIAPPLSDETFSFLATTAGKERRRFRRTNIAAEAIVRRQAQTEGVSAALHNLSSGGFCFSSTDHYDTGERVQLVFEGKDGEPCLIDAKICWQVDSVDGSIAGCQFTSQESYTRLCACLDDLPPLRSVFRPTNEPTSKLVLTAAVLAMFLPPMMTLMMQTNKVAAEPGGVALPTEFIAEMPEVETPTEFEPPSIDPMPMDRQLLAELAAESQTIAEDDVDKPTTDQLSIDAVDDIESEAEPVAELNVEPQTPEPREWVDNTGKYRTLATLLKVTPEHVVLLKPDGKESKVPWRRLSEADQQFARDWQSAEVSTEH